MIKAFYKPEPPKKLFYDKNMLHRSPAYGEEIYCDFLEWEKFHLEKKNHLGDKYKLWRGADLFGEPYDEQKAGKRNLTDAILPPLCTEDACYTLESDGHVAVNGRRTSFVLRVEPKSWSMSVFRQNGGERKFLFVIGKSFECEDVWLQAFRVTKAGIADEPIANVALTPTMDATSKLLCFGKHIFIVHNSKLDYFYFDDKDEVLDRVAIGEDAENADLAWCAFASSVVANGRGMVFWISDKSIYGFSIGYPRQLAKIECAMRERIVHIRCDKNALYVYCKDKNTGAMSCYRYVDGMDGQLRGELCTPADNRA